MKTIRTEEKALESVVGRPDYHRCLDPETYDQKLEGLEEVEAELAKLTFAPSCVDMDWQWQVEEIFTLTPLGSPERAGYRVRTSFLRPDRETGERKRGWGRWMEVPLDITVSGIVKTAFLTCKIILEHELMESFKWKNARVFDPHNTVQELARLGSARYIDGIP